MKVLRVFADMVSTIVLPSTLGSGKTIVDPQEFNVLIKEHFDKSRRYDYGTLH